MQWKGKRADLEKNYWLTNIFEVKENYDSFECYR